MAQQNNLALAVQKDSIQFTIKNKDAVERFLKFSPAALKRLFPSLDTKGAGGDAFNIMACVMELAINLRHEENGKSFFPATFKMERKGGLLIVEMKEASEFYFAGIKPQTNLLNPNGRGTWMTHVYCEATGGRMEVKPELGLTRFEYVVGLPEKEVDARAVEISNRELPLAETIRSALG